LRRRPPPYALRHTFATLALPQGLSTFEVARHMGTSVQMIDQHHGNLARDSMDHALVKLNSIAGARPTRRKLQAVS
jgi:integrase